MTLQETMANQELANVDLSKIAALQQKRTLAFVNHFAQTNVQFLNNFMKNCEEKLMVFERKLEKVNAAMVLLEARLSSIPELNTTTPTEPDKVKTIDEDHTDAATQEMKDSQTPEQTASVDKTPETKPARPEYDRFVKMVQVGVPVQGVKLKISLEGLDPNVLDEILAK